MRLRLLGSTFCLTASILVACSDEASAPSTTGPSTCGADQAACVSGECIPAINFCNGTPDCADGSDEASCGVQCTAEQFQCGSGECVASTAYCNGTPDCADNSDEASCACGADQFACATGECLPLAARCDGTPQCPDGSDEASCAPPGCAAGQVACATGECIAAQGVCDGVPNCPDGSDEANCPTGTGGATGSGGTGAGGGVGSGGNPPVTGTWHCFSSATIQSSLLSEYGSWKSSYYRDCGDGTACIEDTYNGRCVSEGVAYGMLLAVNMNDQDAFDRLWAYYNAHLNANGVMNWETATCGEVWGQNGAADAELDAAMALIQANARWGGGYATDATTLITAIRDHETETCDGRIILKPGDAWGGCSDNGQINPSYFAPGYYRAFAAFVPAQAQHWNDMVDDTYELYDIMQARMGGLLPDWCATDGSDWYGGEYWWEACRVPWRVATDYCWSGDARPATVLSGIDAWVDANGGIAGVDRPANSCYRGGFALTGVSASQAELDANVSAWLANDSEDNAYYQGTLRVLYMLVAASQFPMSI